MISCEPLSCCAIGKPTCQQVTAAFEGSKLQTTAVQHAIPTAPQMEHLQGMTTGQTWVLDLRGIWSCGTRCVLVTHTDPFFHVLQCEA